MLSETKYADIATEQAFLGALFIDPGRVYNIAMNAKVSDDWFTHELCRNIYSAAVPMIQRGQQLDPILIRDEMEKTDIIFPGSITIEIERWMDNAIVPHALHYLSIIKNKWESRVFVRKITEATESLGTTKPIGEVISVLRHELATIPSATVELANMETVFAQEEAAFELAKTKGYSGVQSRWISFQNKFGGWPKGKLTLVGGRPKQGKSTFCNNESAFSARHGTPVAVASMEMTAGEWMVNATCAEAGLDASRFRTGQFSDEEMIAYKHSRDIFKKLPIFINDFTHTIGTLCSYIRDMATDHGCELIIVDYLQMIKGESGKHKTRNDEVGSWSNALANLAKELPDTALVAISQLSRGVKLDSTFKRGEKAKPMKPELHHLRDSGSLEQDAYMVVFVYQDPECGMEILEDNAPTIVEVAARRGGKTGQIELKFEKSKQRFV